MLPKPAARLAGLCWLGCLALAFSCGPAAARPAAPAGSAGVVAAIQVTISAPTHSPKVNVDWPVRITASSAGKPVSGTLTMLVLFGGQPVGKIDNGAVYHFHGSWQERPGNQITWPAAARGEPLTFEVVVKADGATVRKTWAISVH
jgi:hypothetical protein